MYKSSLQLSEKFYAQMVLIRRVEESLLALFEQGLLTGTVHTSLGQEACAVGVVNALDKSRDVLFSNHRAHGHFLAYCDDVEGLIAEILGHPTGICRGIGGTQHLHKDNMYTNGIQGGIVPNAVGAAFAEKLQGSGAITVVFMGDGTMGQGVVYESFNIAARQSLPILFVLEDNQFAQTTPKALVHAGTLSSRANSFNIPTEQVDGNDVMAIYHTTQQIVNQVRQQPAPFFLVLNTYRLGPHSKGDDTRDRAEIDAHRQNDPLRRLAQTLSDDRCQAVQALADRRVAQTIKKVVA